MFPVPHAIPSAGLAIVDDRERVAFVAKYHKKVRLPKGKKLITHSFPKGGVDVEKNESSYDAAIREAMEELSVRRRSLHIIGEASVATYTNYQMGKNGWPDKSIPKRIELFPAFSMQRKFTPKDKVKHPYALWLEEDEFDEYIENEHDMRVLQRIYPTMVEYSQEMRKILSRERTRKHLKVFAG